MAEPPPRYEELNPYTPTEAPKQEGSAPPHPQHPYPHYQVPPVGYPSGSYMPQQTYTMQPGMNPQTIVVAALSFGEEPQNMTCPHCQQQIVSGIRPRSGLLSWLICGGCTLFGCWLCCFIPFCIDRCQDVEHHCPSCKRLLGTYRRI